MTRISLLRRGNKGLIPLVPTTILVLLWAVPKYLPHKAVKVKECTHYDLTEQGLCETCGEYIGL